MSVSRWLMVGVSGAVMALGLSAGCSDKFGTCEERLDCADGGPKGGSAGDAGSSSGGSTGGNDSGSGGQATGGGSSACTETCDGTTPVCDEMSGECVGCSDDDECASDICDENSGKCLDCEDNSDCTDPEASLCDEGVCSPCAANSHCSHLDDATLCDDGACVECTVANEAPCGTKSCNPATLTCTGTDRDSRTRCQTCVADSECKTDYRCVPMEFQGTPRDGGYCLKRVATTCSRPFVAITASRVSLSGATAETFCGVDEQTTTCEAALDHLNSVECDSDDDCGEASLGDGLCKTVNGTPGQCTYRCEVPNQCPSIYSCNGPEDAFYCGGAP